MSSSIHTVSEPSGIDPEIERNGYNIAFGELGLEWFWDAGTYRDLAAIREPKRRVGVYIQAHHPHLLRAYPVDFLARAVEAARVRASGKTTTITH